MGAAARQRPGLGKQAAMLPRLAHQQLAEDRTRPAQEPVVPRQLAPGARSQAMPAKVPAAQGAAQAATEWAARRNLAAAPLERAALPWEAVVAAWAARSTAGTSP